ncbi:hypothetical protein PTKU46_83960 [Paraburkholderia terrae]
MLFNYRVPNGARLLVALICSISRDNFSWQREEPAVTCFLRGQVPHFSHVIRRHTVWADASVTSSAGESHKGFPSYLHWLILCNITRL